MRILITGLCLQGNKGGPAIALSLMARIREQIPESHFILSVPGPPEWKHEQRWARNYGVEVIERITWKDVYPPYCLLAHRAKRRQLWRETARTCDAIVDMTAISYVGPPEGTLLQTVNSRYLAFQQARRAGIPFLAWTQSYGPFSSWPIRFLARRDLRTQPIVYCRGEDCLNAVRHLIPAVNAVSYPDVAVTLEYDPAWGKAYLDETGLPHTEKLITLSPSSVIYRKSQEDNLNRHVESCAELCNSLIQTGYSVLLVPHTMRPDRHDPVTCDFSVGQLVLDRARASKNLAIVEENLNPRQLKSIIANAYVHVGARYHSLVAALSAGVPAVSLSWHPKYADLLRQYGLQDYVIDALAVADTQGLNQLTRRCLQNRKTLSLQLQNRQPSIESAVIENAQSFCNLLVDHEDMSRL